jgi:tRNA 2-thiouridine synthesizing protein A
MSTAIDARGLSCPQPVLMFLNAVTSSDETAFEVFVDTEASKENVSRAAESKKFQVTDIRQTGDEYHLFIEKTP